MQTELRQFIEQCLFCLASVQRVAELLPADDTELDALIGETVQENNPKAFLLVVVAALSRERPVQARHLARGAMLLGHEIWLGSMMLQVQGDVPEPVHQSRVAVRRLRSALAVFRRATPDAPFGALGVELKELAVRLGAARDWDVFLGGTGEAVQTAFADDKRVAALLAAAARKRAAAYAGLDSYLRGDGWHQLALRIALLPTARPWQETADAAQLERLAAPAAEFAVVALQRQRKRVLAAGEDFATLAPLALHEVRKQAKKLRYCSEFFAPMFGAKPVRRFVERLVDLQEALGAVNDGSVAAGLMTELTGGTDRAFAVGVVRGYVAAISAPAASEAARAWRKFSQASPFWD